jgi:hypothetical protein
MEMQLHHHQKLWNYPQRLDHLGETTDGGGVETTGAATLHHPINGPLHLLRQIHGPRHLLRQVHGLLHLLSQIPWMWMSSTARTSRMAWHCELNRQETRHYFLLHLHMRSFAKMETGVVSIRMALQNHVQRIDA